MQGETTLPHVSALDGLRGVAVAGVLLFHGGHLTGGYLGVDLFFVLSGFLITSLLLVESSNTGGVGLGHFWARRARRLLPALIGLLLGVAGYCLVFASRTELGDIRSDAIATLAYVANWRAIFAGQDYWAILGTPSPLQHTWSLAIEEQFYLVWPLVFVGLLAWFGRRAPIATFVTALVGVAISAALMWALYDPFDVSRAYYGTDTRAGGVLLGAALAAALVIWGPVKARGGRIAVEAAGLAGVALLAVAWTRLEGESEWLYRGGLTLCGIAVVAVIAAAVHPRRGVISYAFAWRPLCLLGLISYGVYLWHWPVFIVLNEARTGISGWPLMGVRVMVTVLIATASFLIIEQPIRRGAGSARLWRIAAPVTAVVMVLVLVSVTLGARPRGALAEESVATLSARARGAPSDADKIMVVGNSVGFFLAKSMAQVAPATSKVVLNGAHVACVFPPGAEVQEFAGVLKPLKDPASCAADWDDEISAIEPQHVVIINWTGGQSRFQYGGRWMQPCDPAYDRMYRARLTQAVERFEKSGARVALANSPYAQNTADAANREFHRRVDCVNRVVAGVARDTKAELIDLLGFTCPNAPTCIDQMDGHTLRPDGIHYQFEGGRIVARWVLNQLSAR